MFERLKNKWQITSNAQLLAVLLTFTLAGSSVVWVRKFVFQLLGYTEATPMWIKTVTYLLLLFPSYQLLLLIYGTLLGQFRFFWNKEKALWQKILHKPARK